MKEETLYTAFDNRGYGGRRAGSGRKASGRKKVQLWITPGEETCIRRYLESIRSTDGSTDESLNV